MILKFASAKICKKEPYFDINFIFYDEILIYGIIKYKLKMIAFYFYILT